MERKEFPNVIHINMGNDVLCDWCGRDCSDGAETGGMIFDNKAFCPLCAQGMMKTIRKYHQEDEIEGVCPPDKSFADFVRDFRGGPASVRISRG